MLELVVVKRRRGWDWRVRDQKGTVIAGGRERTRAAARYHAYRALFLLIATGWPSRRRIDAPMRDAAGSSVIAASSPGKSP